MDGGSGVGGHEKAGANILAEHQNCLIITEYSKFGSGKAVKNFQLYSFRNSKSTDVKFYRIYIKGNGAEWSRRKGCFEKRQVAISTEWCLLDDLRDPYGGRARAKTLVVVRASIAKPARSPLTVSMTIIEVAPLATCGRLSWLPRAAFQEQW